MKIETRKHLERSQPVSRQKFGLLEKHKDYVLRARDFNAKKTRLKILQEKARFRNEDEFYHEMINSTTKRGVQVALRNNQFDGDLLRLLKSQDLKNVQYHRDLNRKKMQKIKDELKALGICPEPSNSERKHLKFASDVQEAMNYAELSTADEKEFKIQVNYDVEKRENVEIGKLLKELDLRFARAEALQKAEDELQLQKNLNTSKGKRFKVGKDERGNDIFKWRAQRMK